MSASWRVLSLANGGPLERLCRVPLSVSTSLLQGRQAGMSLYQFMSHLLTVLFRREGRYGRRRKRVIRRPPAWTPVKVSVNINPLLSGQLGALLCHTLLCLFSQQMLIVRRSGRPCSMLHDLSTHTIFHYTLEWAEQNLVLFHLLH